MNTPRDELPRISSINCQVLGGSETERLSMVLPEPEPGGLPAPGLAPPCGIRRESLLSQVDV
jgi:hypothetical protein